MATPSSGDARPPAEGDVIEFSFLWKHERAAGRIEGVKDRRCVIVRVLEGGGRVLVVPITGTEPAHGNKIPLPPNVFGLVRQSWIVTSELNLTIWPGHDLRPARKPAGAWWRYGRLSDALKLRVAREMRSLMQAGGVNVTIRN